MPDLLERILWRLSAGRRWYPTLTVRAGVGRGLKISLRNASADYVAGTNEVPVQEAVAGHLRPGAVFYDIGSNVGFFALAAARIVTPAGRVYAFEPVPGNAECIRANAARNGFDNLEVLEVAVAAEDGTATLHTTEHPGGATLAEDAGGDVTGRVEVAVATVDGLLASGRLEPPDFVKVDVEGAELDVLLGMETTIREHRPTLLVELDAADVGGVERKVAQVRGILAASGYGTEELPISYGDTAWHVRHLLALHG